MYNGIVEKQLSFPIGEENIEYLITFELNGTWKNFQDKVLELIDKNFTIDGYMNFEGINLFINF